MTQYYVEVHTYHPYKIAQTFTEKGSTYAIAVKRAIDKFKKLEKNQRSETETNLGDGQNSISLFTGSWCL